MADGGHSGGRQRKTKLPVADSQEQTLARANLDSADLASITVLLAKAWGSRLARQTHWAAGQGHSPGPQL